jgi:S1-C subfamily serine protease
MYLPPILRGVVGCLTVAALLPVSLFSAETSPGSAPAQKSAPAPAPSAALAVPASEIASEATSAAIENSVVKVFATMRRPDLFKPWTKQAPGEGSGTGIIIEGKRILTNAHVVMYASQVQVQANQSGEKISATVESIGPDIDLAVLKLEDESLFASRPPIPRARSLPDVKEPVMAFGYPTGGTNLSITKGIVSRIDFVGMSGFTSALRIQIDAAINPGNSGGPAVSANKMIGIAFSRATGGTQNIGYIIPNEEIDLFLADVADGRYDGKPSIYDSSQTLENPALRAYLKIEKSTTGVVVIEPFGRETETPLRKWDVVTKIGETTIDDLGMIKPAGMPRVSWRYQVQRIARDGKVPLTVIRAGKEMKIELPALNDRPLVVPDLRGAYPSYFVFGPLAFSPATAQFAGSFESSAPAMSALSATGNPMILRKLDRPAFAGEELVLVSSPFFPHKLSKGYSNPVGRVVESLNGQPVKNLKHLVELLRDSTDEFIKLEFFGRGSPAVLLPRKETIAATEEILTDNGVRAQGSPDTLAVWNRK